MGLNDYVYSVLDNPICRYVLYENPVSQTVKTVMTEKSFVPSSKQITVITEKTPLWKLARENGSFLRLASVMGASAVALGAYGAHRKYPEGKADLLKPVFETANRMHFFHSLALLGVPMSRNPAVAGSLFLMGTILFSGPCYYYAFTGENKLGKLAPIGGTILIVAWLSLAF
ncbi:transmembrane protein 256 homolog [Coccinella septempunctata]|uniref:transmembrane protein 256 homolog n=1 Tax=Coccinella septempunctata TaxID=41139 RepID=UPI001D0755EF|nr:transmembrane protein 256 homolog [Coccinella septempunctata]